MALHSLDYIVQIISIVRRMNLRKDLTKVPHLR